MQKDLLTKTIICQDNKQEAQTYIEFLNKELIFSVVVLKDGRNEQYDFNISEEWIHALAYAYRKHCEKLDKKS